MAKKATQIVRTYHQAARSRLALFVLPAMLIPTVIFGLMKIDQQQAPDEELRLYWYAVPTVFLLLFPLWAKVQTFFFTRYRVTLDSVIEQRGLIARQTSEIRIADIKNIVVRQSFLDRLVLVGDVSFSSSAGAGVEVTFSDIARPGRVRDLVKDIQDRLSDGALSEGDVAAIRAEANPKQAARRGRKHDEDEAPAKTPETPAGQKRVSTSTRGSLSGPQATLDAEVLQAIESKPESSAAGGDGAADKGEEAEEAGSAGGEVRDELDRLLAEQAAAGKAEE